MHILLLLLQHFNIQSVCNYTYLFVIGLFNNCRCEAISLLVLIGGTTKKVDLL